MERRGASLGQINPDDLDFHAARYESCRLLQEAVRVWQSGKGDWTIPLSLAVEATEGDGGGWGCFPCLAPEIVELAFGAWNQI